MEKMITIGLDLAKSVFQVHGIAGDGTVVARRALRRSQVLDFFRGIDPCCVGIEACASSHYWANAIGQLGHTVKMMSPTYVKASLDRGGCGSHRGGAGGATPALIGGFQGGDGGAEL